MLFRTINSTREHFLCMLSGYQKWDFPRQNWIWLIIETKLLFLLAMYMSFQEFLFTAQSRTVSTYKTTVRGRILRGRNLFSICFRIVNLKAKRKPSEWITYWLRRHLRIAVIVFLLQLCLFWWFVYRCSTYRFKSCAHSLQSKWLGSGFLFIEHDFVF